MGDAAAPHPLGQPFPPRRVEQFGVTQLVDPVAGVQDNGTDGNRTRPRAHTHLVDAAHEGGAVCQQTPLQVQARHRLGASDAPLAEVGPGPVGRLVRHVGHYEARGPRGVETRRSGSRRSRSG